MVFLRNIDLKGATGLDTFRAGPFTRYLLLLSTSEIEGSDEVFFALKVASAGTSKFTSVLVVHELTLLLMVGDLNLEVLAVVDNAQTFVVDPDNKGVLVRFVLLDVEGDHVFTLVSVLANMGLCGGNVNVGLSDADLELAPLDRRSELKKRSVAKKNLDLSLRILTTVFF